MSETHGRGFLALTLSEWARQLLLTLQLLLALLGVQAGLLLAAVLALLRPRLEEHAAVLRGGALPREQELLAAAAAGVLLSSALVLGWATAGRARGKSRRRGALPLGHLSSLLLLASAALLFTLFVLLETRLRAFRAAYHAGFSRALWRYADSVRLKEYVDRTQSRYRCCGSLGFSDWFVVDWYPLGLYVARYTDAVRRRDKFAGSGGAFRASFAMQRYGSEAHAERVLAALDAEYRRQELHPDLLEAKLRVGFSEVPFSCCDPAAPAWCRQMHVTEPAPHYAPPQNLTVFSTGCTTRVPGFFTWYLWVSARVALAAAGLQALVLLLCRYSLSSMSNALAAGRHLSPAPGWLFPLWRRAEPPGEDATPLMEDAEGDEGTETEDTGTDAESTGTDAEDTETDADDTGTDTEGTETDADTGTDVEDTETDTEATGTTTEATGSEGDDTETEGESGGDGTTEGGTTGDEESADA